MKDDRRSPFRVGDRLTVHTEKGGPQSIQSVRAFTHDGRCLELSDGSEWRADGRRQWGHRGSHYTGPWLEPEAEGDAAHVAKRRAIGAIRKFANDLSMDTALDAEALKRIVAAIDRERGDG